MEGLNKNTNEKVGLSESEGKILFSIMQTIESNFPYSKEEKEKLQEEKKERISDPLGKALERVGEPVLTKEKIERTRKIINDLFDKLK